MYDVEKLEKEWLAYKRKKYTFWVVLVVLSVLFVLMIVFRAELMGLTPWGEKDANSSMELNSSLKPYVPTMLVEANESQEDEDSIKSPDSDDASQKKRKYLKIEVTESDLVEDDEQEFLEEDDDPTIKSAKANFEQFNSANDSLYLARAYYKMGEYDKAQKWALATNNIDNGVEESWFIFAKSKAKSGYKQEAIEILSAYIKKRNSAKARVLLQKIKKGNF
jgi:tetratricopeptide (TPR) repeat protein